MEMPQSLPDPSTFEALTGVLVKILAPIVALILGALSWVWSTARSAKQCAFEAKVKVERADVAVEGLTREIRGLRSDMVEGFKGTHARLDKHLDK